MYGYHTPEQLADQEFADFNNKLNAIQNPNQPIMQNPNSFSTFETAKQKWVTEAQRLNPNVDFDTISNIYDQKIAPAIASGQDPTIRSDNKIDKFNNMRQTQIKQSLTYPSSGMFASFGKGLERGVKDIGQGLKQLTIQFGENYPEINSIVKPKEPIVTAPEATKEMAEGLSKSLLTALGTYTPSSLITPQAPGNSEAYRAKVNAEIAQYEEDTEHHSLSAGVGRLLGNIVATLPMGAIGGEAVDLTNLFGSQLMREVATNSMIGGTIGGLEYDPSGQNRTSRAMFGALIGAAIPGGYYGAKGTLKWLFKKPTLIDDPAVLETAANRVKEAKELGIDQLTAGAATREPLIQTIEQRILKQKGAAADLFREKHQEISNQIYNVGQKMTDAIGGKQMANEVLGGELQSALQDTQRLARNSISKMYEAAAEAPGAQNSLERGDILNTFENLKQDFVDLKLSPAINNALDGLGTKIKDNYANPYNILTANKLIQSINKAYRNTALPDTRAALNILKSKVMDSIDRLADDVTNPSRTLFNLARHFRKELGDIYDQQDIVGLLTRKKGSTTNYIAPEHVAGRIFGTRENITNLNKIEKALQYRIPADKWITEAKKLNPDTSFGDLQEIYTNNIEPQFNKNAQLWEDLKTNAFNKLINDSTIHKNGLPQLSYQALVKNVKNMGQSSLRKILGNDELADKFNKLIKVMDYWQNQAPSVATRTKAANALHRMAGGIIGMIGDPETRMGLMLHSPIKLLSTMLEHINDMRWVKANLLLGGQDTYFMQVAKKSPGVIEHLINNLKAYLGMHQIQQMKKMALQSAPILSALQPGGTATQLTSGGQS